MPPTCVPNLSPIPVRAQHSRQTPARDVQRVYYTMRMRACAPLGGGSGRDEVNVHRSSGMFIAAAAAVSPQLVFADDGCCNGIYHIII